MVSVGMCDYFIPDEVPLKEIRDNETYCTNFQVMTFEQLEKIISKEKGGQYKIVDTGSGPVLGEYQAEGRNCTVQAVYAQMFLRLKTKT